MRQWQDADATHLSVSTMGASQKTVDHHLAALATAAEAADDQRLRAACGSRSQDLIFHVKLGFWNSGSRQHVRTVYYYVRMTASPGRGMTGRCWAGGRQARGSRALSRDTTGRL
jgi:hypothetical protein